MTQPPQPTATMQPFLRVIRLSHLGYGPKIAVVVLLVIVILAILAPWIAPHDPMQMDPLSRLKGPIDRKSVV